jgi:ankyrin repeat protein
MKKFLSGIFGNPTNEEDASKPEEFFNEFVVALKSRDHEKVGQLIARNMRLINSKNRDGMCVLAVAAAGGSREAVEMLLRAGAYIDGQDNFGMTALMWAVTNGRKEVVECLLDAGASIDRYNKFDGTALTIARSTEYKDIEELLKKRSGL